MRKKRIHLGFLLGAILGSFIFLGKGEALTPLEGYLPQIEGWVIKGEVLKFSPENLFEYIDFPIISKLWLPLSIRKKIASKLSRWRYMIWDR